MRPERNLDETLKWLQKDHDDARQAIDKFDGQLFTIRNWAISGGGALLAVGLTQDSATTLFLSVLPVLVFMYLELTYKCFHEDALERSSQLDSLINEILNTDQISSDYQFGLSQVFELPSFRKMWRIGLKRRHILLFYFGIVGTLLVAAYVVQMR